MINGNELRIGNILQVQVSSCSYASIKIKGITDTGLINPDHKTRVAECGIEDLEGIPLTPEILESCGFVGEVWKDFKLPVLCEGQEITLTMCASSNNRWALCMKGFSEQGVDEFEIAEIFKDLKREKYPNGIGITHKENFMALKNIQYLHQLQNLYFALTGEELNINLNVEVTNG